MTIELKVLCEGPTESNFVSLVLGPHLAAFQVFPKAAQLTPKGYGIVSFDTLRKGVQNEIGRLKGHQYVTTMVDLYGLRDFPGNRPGERDVYQRVKAIERAMAEEFKNSNVIPYVQLHEFETLVYVDLEQLNNQYPDGSAKKAVETLQAEVGALQPELINDGPETAPSKRLLKVLPAYRKVVDGPAIAQSIGIQRLRAACPHFGQWLTRLEQLAD